jgi:hypothetical protein
VFLTARSDVAGYVSWGSNDFHADEYCDHAIPGHRWSPAALAETYVSTSARTFCPPPSYGQSLVADLLEEGASGVKGYVYEPYVSSMADAAVLFDRYTGGSTLAESFFMASRYLSWMDVVVGDPKTTVEPTTEGALPVHLGFLAAAVGPAGRGVELRWTTLSEINCSGFFVQRRIVLCGPFENVCPSIIPASGTTVAPHAYSWTDADVAPGHYEYRLRQIDLDGTAHHSEPVAVVVPAITGVPDLTAPDVTQLRQNFPNPFNPCTTIPYELSASEIVRLVVYDHVGREVAVLVDGRQAAGSYRIPFSGAFLASGLYVYSLRTEHTTLARSMLLLQ